jgi:hypothetical protein
VIIRDGALRSVLDIPGAAAPLELVADIARRTIDIGMTLRAPEDKVSSKARINWLLRQIKSEKLDELFVRLSWPGRSETTQFAILDLLADPSICEKDKAGLQVVKFHIFISKRLGAKFTQQTNFIKELENAVPLFYREIGQNLAEWRKPAPRIKTDKLSSADVNVSALQGDADDSTKDY